MFLFRSGSHLCLDPFQVFSLLWRWRPPYCCKPYSGCLSPLFQTHRGLCAPLIHCFPGKAASTSSPRMTAVSPPQCHVASFSSSGPFLTHFIGAFTFKLEPWSDFSPYAPCHRHLDFNYVPTCFLSASPHASSVPRCVPLAHRRTHNRK